MEQYKQDFIDFMVESGALLFGDFITKSGRKTPFFINAGNFNTGRQLDRLGTFYAQAIHARFGTGFDVLFGPAYKGIPLSVAASMAFSRLYDRDIAYASNRKEIKDHGDTGILLGHKLKDGDRVIIIEDVTTAGTSIAETMPILKARGEIAVLGLIIAVDRMERGQGQRTALAELRDLHGFTTGAIVTMAEVVEYLFNRTVDGRVLIDGAMKSRIEDYYRQYGAEA
jgi:orotate phosphoribosyltransferase